MMIPLFGLLFLLALEAGADLELFPNSTSYKSSSSQPEAAAANTTTSFSNSTSPSISAFIPLTALPSGLNASTQEPPCGLDDSRWLNTEVQYFKYGPSCSSLFASSFCAWKSSQVITWNTIGTVETATDWQRWYVNITTGEASESSFTTVYSVVTYKYMQTFFIEHTDSPSSTTNTLTFTPTEIAKLDSSENCCGSCAVGGTDARVYFWPTPALTPPVSELIDPQGLTL